MNLRRISISLGASLLFITAAALTTHAQANYTRDAEPADGRGIHAKDRRIHDGKIFQLAADGLSAGIAERADAESGARRCRRRAGEIAVLGRGLSLHAHAREGEPARESVFDRHDRRRPRDDCRGDRF